MNNDCLVDQLFNFVKTLQKSIMLTADATSWNSLTVARAFGESPNPRLYASRLRGQRVRGVQDERGYLAIPL